MGLTYVHARLRKSEGLRPSRDVRFFCRLGSDLFRAAGGKLASDAAQTGSEVEFTLADGTAITRGVSECRFEIRGEAATSPVVLGEAGDSALLGAVTLETLGFMLNPLTREILPIAGRCRTCGGDS